MCGPPLTRTKYFPFLFEKHEPVQVSPGTWCVKLALGAAVLGVLSVLSCFRHGFKLVADTLTHADAWTPPPIFVTHTLTCWLVRVDGATTDGRCFRSNAKDGAHLQVRREEHLKRKGRRPCQAEGNQVIQGERGVTLLE